MYRKFLLRIFHVLLNPIKPTFVFVSKNPNIIAKNLTGDEAQTQSDLHKKCLPQVSSSSTASRCNSYKCVLIERERRKKTREMCVHSNGIYAIFMASREGLRDVVWN